MRPLRVAVWGCALAFLSASGGPAKAAWSNVFQVTCRGCGAAPAASYYTPAVSYAAPAADACCNPCPQVCTTRYVQRCYYQPVTTYQSRSYYEAVTTYRTSYYYEPVTSYRYTCHYDPCTCSYQQVACPTTCYQLRSQCCPVQSWVQRCCQVPVTSYQQAFYYEPVTSCCTPSCAPACPTGYGAPGPVAAAPVQPVPQGAAPVPPAVSEQAAPAGPGVRESRDGAAQPYDRYYQPPATIPPAQGSGYRQGAQPLPQPPAAAPGSSQPTVRLDRIVTGPIGQVQGTVVRQDQSPRGGARLTFINGSLEGGQRTATTNSAGQFRVTLASGGWLVYVEEPGAKPAFVRKIDVRDNQTHQVMLVSR